VERDVVIIRRGGTMTSIEEFVVGVGVMAQRFKPSGIGELVIGVDIVA
jgi:hypothetical protein